MISHFEVVLRRSSQQLSRMNYCSMDQYGVRTGRSMAVREYYTPIISIQWLPSVNHCSYYTFICSYHKILHLYISYIHIYILCLYVYMYNMCVYERFLEWHIHRVLQTLSMNLACTMLVRETPRCATGTWPFMVLLGLHAWGRGPRENASLFSNSTIGCLPPSLHA